MTFDYQMMSSNVVSANSAKYFDLHRHLGGSIPPDVIAGFTDLDYKIVKSMMEVPKDAVNKFEAFLRTFDVLDDVTWDISRIRKSVAAVCKSLINEKVQCCWMDFSVDKYMKHFDMTSEELIKIIHSEFVKRSRDVQVGLVLSVKYESIRDYKKKFFIKNCENVLPYLVGIDFVGDERSFDPKLLREMVAPWSYHGKMVRMHVGEACGVRNIYDAIQMGATNIAHGIKIIQNAELLRIARRVGVTFDVAITSNYLTGVLDEGVTHPIIRMVRSGLPVTIGSDDPIQCNTDIHKEFRIAKKMGITKSERNRCVEVARLNFMKYIS